MKEELDGNLFDIEGFDNPEIVIKSKYDIVYYGSTGNVKGAIEAINKMKSGEYIILDYRTYPIADKTLFEAIAGKNVNIVFEGENAQWVFNGKKVKKSKCKKINLSVNVYSEKGSIYGCYGDKEVLVMEFAPNGTLPGKAQIRVGDEYLKAKYKVNNKMILSYYNKSPEVLDKNVTMAKDQFAEFEIVHNSTYVLSDNMPRLLAPKNVKCSVKDIKTVSISFNRVIGAKGYTVFRSTKKNGKYKRVADYKPKKTKSRYTVKDKSVIVGKKYYYKVKAYGASKNVKALVSPRKSVKVKPKKVTGAAIDYKDASKEEIRWYMEKYCTGYEVYATDGKKYRKYQTISNNSNCCIFYSRKYKYAKVRAYVVYKGKKIYGKFSKKIKL